MFFNTWMDVVRVLVAGTCAYLALVVLLRVSGKRTLSKMNAFDFVVTVALGSTLASVILSKQIALVEGVVALALLVGLQYAITWLSVRSPAISRLVKAEPSLLLYQGRFLPEQMRRSRVLESEVQAAVREQGILSLDQVKAVVLETDGSITVIQPADSERPSALAGVQNVPSGAFGDGARRAG